MRLAIEKARDQRLREALMTLSEWAYKRAARKHRKAHRENSKRIYRESNHVGGIRKKDLDGKLEGLTKRQISRARSWLRLKGFLE